MYNSSGIGWILIVAGLGLVLVGVLFVLGPSVRWLGRLPGDVRIEREHFRFYFPIMTCVLISLLLTLVAWIMRWLK